MLLATLRGTATDETDDEPWEECAVRLHDNGWHRSADLGDLPVNTYTLAGRCLHINWSPREYAAFVNVDGQDDPDTAAALRCAALRQANQPDPCPSWRMSLPRLRTMRPRVPKEPQHSLITNCECAYG